MKSIIYTSHAPAPLGPYSQAILADNTLYVSGQIAINPATGDMVQSDIAQETHQVMQNLKAILSEAGFEWSDLVKASIFLTDLNNFVNVNNVYSEYLNGPAPARETVEVSRLPKNANVEISCIAVRS
jgi:2-iminobutanoate/2-iminopropanoate deaminase